MQLPEMKEMKSVKGWGIVLIGFGVMLLLQSIGLIRSLEGVLGSVTLAAAGLLLVSLWFNSDKRWWVILPATVLLTLALSVAAEEHLLPHFFDRYAGEIFAVFAGLAFIAIFWRYPNRWWAIFPGGGLLSIGAAVIAEEMRILRPFIGPDGESGIFFFGMGLTFGLLYFKGRTVEGERRAKWAVYPMLALMVLGTMIIVASSQLTGFVAAAALIVAGVYLLSGRRQREELPAR